MAATVDERIVAAKFDASDFEKGVNKTIKKLDELKKSLNLKEATKGVEELAEKTQASTDSMSKSLDKLTDRMTTFVGMVKQKILGGLADEVANVFLKMEQSVTGFIKSISSDQVRSGMAKYEQMLTSVRVLMSAGESESVAYKYIDQLRDYSDQTSYSLSQMTDALSKMRSAGVDIDTATKSVEGIANACASAGINATDAQRAFYNLAQAYGKGTLNYTDYKSLELLNMTTEKFKEDLLEAAVEAKTLKKVSDGVYQTINTTDKKVKSGKKVTVKNLQDMLKYDFINNEAMNKLFGKKFYFDERAFKKYKEKWIDPKTGEVDREKAIEEAKKDFGEIAVDAYLAAREARSFTDVINTLKDVVSTGWGTTFEFLFGKLEEAKEFFTELAEGELADVVYKIGEYRNAILGFWDNGVGNTGGGEVFRQTILNIADALGTLLKTVLQILPGFDELTYDEEKETPILQSLGEKLFVLSMNVRDFSRRVKEAAQNFNAFMNSPVVENGPTRIELIRKTLSNLLSVFSIMARVVSIAFNTITQAFYTLSPIFDGFLQLLAKITEPITTLKDSDQVFNDIQHSIDNILTILDPIAKTLGTIIGFLGEVGTFIAQMALDTVTSNIQFFSDTLGIFMEVLTGNSAQMEDGEGVLAKICEDFEGIKDACRQGLSAVKEFFGALLGDIKRLLGLTDEAEKDAENQNGGIFAGLIHFFDTNEFVQKAKAWVDQAIVDVGNFIKSIPSRVMKFGANIYDTLRGLFFKDETQYNGSTLETKSVLTPLGEWVDQAIKDIKEFVISIPQRIIDGVGAVTNWINEVFDYWFSGRKTDLKHFENDGGKWVEKDTILVSRFEEFIYDARAAIIEWFDKLPSKIINAFQSVGNFASNLYSALDEFLFGKKVETRYKEMDSKGRVKITTVTTRYKKGFSKWLDSVIKDIKKFITKIPEYVKAGIKGAGDIVSTVIGALFGKAEDKDVTDKDIEDRLAKPFKDLNLSNIINTIKDIGQTILNEIARIFTGTDDIEANTQWFSEVIASGIRWIREKAYAAVKWVVAYVKNIPARIAELFSGEDKNNATSGPIGSAITEFGQAIGKFLTEDLPAAVLDFVDGAVDLFGTIWDKLYNAIIGDAEKESKDGQTKIEKRLYPDAMAGDPRFHVKSKWEQFVERLGKTISHIWEELPVWIANGIELAVVAIDKIVSNIGEWIKGLGVSEKVEGAAETVTAEATQGMAKSAENGEDQEEPALVTAIKKIGERIKDLFVETIPTFIHDAWDTLAKMGTDIFEGVSSIFSGTVPDNERQKAVATAAGTIKNFFVEKLPGKIQEGWAKIANLGSQIWNGFASIFTGDTPKTEIEKAINSFGALILTTITHTIPEFIRKAFDSISKIFNSSKDAWKTNIVADDDMYKQTVAAVEDQQRQADKRLKTDSQKSGIWTFVEGFKDSFMKAFESIGPTILNGISTALGWISNVASIVIDALTGEKSIADRVEDAYGKEKPELKQAITNIGNSLKTFFLDTIPKLIGSAIGALMEQAPIWFHNLFGAMNGAAKAEGDKAADDLQGGGGMGSQTITDAVTNASGVMGIVKNLFETLKNWVGENHEFLEIMGVIIALTLLFNKMGDLFSSVNVIDSATEAIKWGAITIAISAIAGILSYISNIVESNDPEKIENFKQIIDKLGNMFLAVSAVVGLMSVGKWGEAFGSKWSGGSEKVGLSEKLLGGLADAFTGFFKSLGISAGVGAGASLAGAGINSFLTSVSDAFLTLSSGVDDMMKQLAPFVDELVETGTKLEDAITAATRMADLFTTLYNIFGKVYYEATGGKAQREAGTDIWVAGNTVGTYEAPTTIEDFMKKLQQRVDLFTQLAGFISNIANTLDKVSNIDNVKTQMDKIKEVLITEDFKNFMTDLMDVLKMAVDASEIAPEKFGSSQYMVMRQSGMALALEMLGDALSIFGNGIAGLNETNVTAFDKMLDVFAKLYGALGDVKLKDNYLAQAFLGDSSLSKLGSEIKLFGMYMKTFYEYIKDIPGFKNSELSSTSTKIDNIIAIATSMAEAANNLKSAFSVEALGELGQTLPTLGEQIAEFAKSLNRGLAGITPERLDMVAQATGAVSDLSTILSAFPHYTTPTQVIDNMYSALSGDNHGKFAATFRLVVDAIRDAFVSEDSHREIFDAGKTLATYLVEGINDALTSDPELRLTPVLNMDTATQQLKDFFGVQSLGEVDLGAMARSAFGANAQTDEDRVKASELNTKLDALEKAINGISGSTATVNDVIAAFTGMKIITDTGVLAGEMSDKIDELIGKKIWLIEQGVTP